jgi:uncharacterized membrane protein
MLAIDFRKAFALQQMREAEMATGYERRSDTRYEANRPARSEREVEQSARVLAGTFSAETIAAAAAVILAILGLAEIYPEYMLPSAAVLIGAAFLIKGGGIASRYRQLAAQTGSGVGTHLELGGGISAEVCAGLAGIVLGVLALLEIAPGVLLAVSIIVFGAALLFSGGETYRVNQLQRALERDDVEYNARITAEAAAGGEALVGIAAIVLGILALTGVEPVTLIFAGLLAVAGILVLSAMASGTHAAMLLRR